MPHKPSILFIDDLAPLARYGAGHGRSADTVGTLLQDNLPVTLYLQAKRAHDGDIVKSSNGRVQIDYAHQISLPDLLAKLGDTISHIWVSRFSNMRRYGAVLRAWKQVAPGRRMLICDTEALTSLRALSFQKNIFAPQNREACLQAAEDELSATTGFDKIVCVSDFETNLAAELAPWAKSIKLNSMFAPAIASPGCDGRKDFIFCGAFHTQNTPNMESVHWFCDRVWPHIKQALPEAEFHIAGYVAPNLKFPDIVTGTAKIVGPIDDLASLYDRYRVFVAPTRLAVGIPHKVLNAMALGLPSVITTLLALQIAPQHGTMPFFHVAPQAQPFAKKCIKLYRGDAYWGKVQEHGLAEIRRQFNIEQYKQAIMQILAV